MKESFPRYDFALQGGPPVDASPRRAHHRRGMPTASSPPLAETPTLELLPMTLGYFRLVLRSFGDTPERRAAILAGTSVSEEMLNDPSADISLFQQVRQVENLVRLFGEGWAMRSPELWYPSSHGPLGVAAIAAPDVAAMMEIVTRFSFVRAPFYHASLRRGPE